MTAVDLLVRHGPDLALGTTLLLAVAALASRFHRSPLHVQRLGEAGVFTALAFVALALLPLPRPLSDLVTLPEGAPAPTTQGALLPLDGLRRVAGLLPERDPISVRPSSGSAEPTRQDPTLAWPVPGGGGHLARTAGPDRWPDDQRELGVASDTLTPLDVSLATAGATSGADPMAGQEANLALTADPTADPRPSPGPPGHDPMRIGARVLLAGSALGLAWLVLGALRLVAILRSSRPAPDWVAGLLEAGHGARRVRLVVTDRRTGPFCVGALRPTIVLPRSLCAPGRTDGLRAVLLHEMGHALAGDGAGRLVLTAALPVLWWHPLYWWLRRSVRLASELRADDHAAAHTGKGAYARRLLDLASEGLGAGPVPLSAPSVFGSTTDLSRRIEMLMHRTDRLAVRCSTLRRGAQGALASGLLALSALAFGAAPASAQDADLQIERLHAERAQLLDQVAALAAERESMAVRLLEMERRLQQMQLQMEAMHVAPMAAQVADARAESPEDFQRRRDDSARHAQELAMRLLDETQADQARVLEAERALAAALQAQGAAADDVAAADLFRELARGLGAAEDAADQAAEHRAQALLQLELQALQQQQDAAVAAEQAARARQQAEELAVLGQLGYLGGGEGGGSGGRNDTTWRELITGFGGPSSGGATGTGGGGPSSGGGASARGGAPSSGPATGTGGGGAPRSMSGHDAMALIERVMDQEAEIRLAEVELSQMRALAEEDYVGEHELLMAETRLDLAHRKVDMARALLHAEMRALEVEIDQCHAAMDADPGARATLVRLEAQLELLASMFPSSRKGEGHAR